MSENSSQKLLQRILIVGSGLAFLGLMTFPLISLLNSSSQRSNQENSPQQSPPATPALAPSVEKELKIQAEGYQKVLAREPDNLTALEGLAKAKLQLRDWQGAIEPLQKLSQKSPENPNILKALAQAHLQTQDWQGAIQPLEKLVKQYPQEKAYLQFLGQAQLNTQDLKGAIATTEKLIKISSENERQQYEKVLIVLKQQAGEPIPKEQASEPPEKK